MSTSLIKVPAGGQKIVPGQAIPDNPIIPFIEGDGIGVDITPVMIKVIDAAVEKAYGGKKRIHWMEVYAGEKSTQLYGPDEWFPKETFDALKEYSVSIKGPMTTPVGGGIRSLNVALRQELDLYQCVRPVQYFKGVPSPLKNPELTNMVIFRENTEDIYAGIEWAAESEGAKKVVAFLQNEMGVKKIRFPATSGIGIKPISIEGTTRLVRAALKYVIANDRKSLTIVHKGNIMKFTEGLFRDTAYKVAQEEFGAQPIDGGPWCKFANPKTGREIIVKDAIADAFLQQILLRPAEYDTIVTTNLNGDYISDALAAQVGGIGIAPFAVEPERAAFSLRRLAPRLQFLAGQIAAIGMPGIEQLLGNRCVAIGPGKLERRRFIAHQAEPFEAVEDRRNRRFGGAGAVGVLDPQQVFAAMMPREQPVEQGGARAADMQVAGGRGGKAPDDHAPASSHFQREFQTRDKGVFHPVAQAPVAAQADAGLGVPQKALAQGLFGFGVPPAMDLGVRRLRLLTNNPKKLAGLQGYGLEVAEQVPLVVAPNAHNQRYLATKRDKSGHLL